MKNNKKRIWVVSAKTLLQAIVGVSLLTLGVSVIVVFALRVMDVKAAAFESLLKDSRRISTTLDQLNRLYLYEAIRLTQEDSIRQFQTQGCNGLKEVLGQKPGVSNIAIYSIKGDLVCSAIPISTIVPGDTSVRNEEFFNNIVSKNEPSIGKIKKLPVNERLVYSIAAPIFDNEKILTGLFVYLIDLEEQKKSVYNLATNKAGAYLLNHDGALMADLQDKLQPEEIKKSLQWMERLREDVVFKQPEERSLVLRLNDGDFVGLVKMGSTQWLVATRMSQSDVYGGLVESLLIQIGAFGLAALIGLLIATRISIKIANAISQLVSVATNERTKVKSTGIVEIDKSMGNIVQARRATQEAQKAMRLWYQTAERSSAGLALISIENGKTKIERANTAFFKLSGLAKNVMNIGLEELPAHSALKDPAPFRALMMALKNGDQVECVGRGQDAFGRDVHIALDLAPLDGEKEQLNKRQATKTATNQVAEMAEKSDLNFSEKRQTKDMGERVAGLFALTLDDLTVLIEREEQIQRHSTTDALTGLPNRTLFGDRLHQAIEMCSLQHKQFAVAFLNIDRFKQINDTLGHDAGDHLLITTAKRLRQKLPLGDTLCRLSADEFGIILNEHGDGRNELAVALEHIKDVFSSAFVWNEQNVMLTCSVGVSIYPLDGQDSETLKQRTDIALFQAKQDGGAKLTYYDHEMRVRFEERALLEQDMKAALKQQMFEMYYQPKIDLKTLRPIGMEALIRWKTGNGFISPAKFIPLAEESGLIGELGRFALRQSLMDANELLKLGYEVPVAVNISAKQLEVGFIEEIKDALDASGLPHKMLHAEITESLILPNSIEAISFFNALERMGIVVSLDDFGTGWSNLATLKQLPLSALKMDRSFVDGLGGNDGDAALAQAVVSMASALDLYVIAEGVETKEQARILTKMGASQAQGYLFAKPMNLTSLVEWMQINYNGCQVDLS